MQKLVRSIAFVAAAAALMAAHGPVNNPIDVVVSNGPYVGSYKADASDSYCMHIGGRDILSASWQSAKAAGPKTFSLAAIDVSNYKGSAAKTANAHVGFGDPHQKPFVYDLTRMPLTMARNGKVLTLTVQGKTAQGVQLRVTASCGEIEELP
ncbi:MAG: hypothetical protein JJD97_01300 [Gemmatimonadaceae bacterium]|nr:hypothetical protein [Gemmatimonadaceae bacterium]